MKTKIFVAALCVGACASAVNVFAGPEPLPSGKEMKEVAPAPAPVCPSWTGFYIGGQLGYKRVNSDLDLDLFGDWDRFGNGPEKELIISKAPDNLDADAFEGGGFIGYNMQFNHIVVGAEVAGNYVSADESSDLQFPFGSSDAFVETSFESHYLVTAAPRVGYAFCRFLPYVTGGLAIGEIDFRQRVGDRNPDGSGVEQRGSVHETKLGWMAGGGLQYALSDHWSLRVQYQYIDLGDEHFRTESEETGELFPGFNGRHEVSVTEHNASFGIIYSF